MDAVSGILDGSCTECDGPNAADCAVADAVVVVVVAAAFDFGCLLRPVHHCHAQSNLNMPMSHFVPSSRTTM